MVVGRHALDGLRVNLHDVRQVADERGKQKREDRDERGQALAQGHAAQDAGLGGLHVEVAAGVLAVDHRVGVGAHAGLGPGGGNAAGGNGERVARGVLGASGLYEGLAAGGLVPGAKQQRHDDEAGQKGRSALAHEGQGDARERQELGHAAHDEKRLEAQGAREAHGCEGGGVGLGAGCGGKAAHAQEQEQHQHGGGAQKAHLLADGREDEVGLNHGDVGGQALADARAHQAAVGQGVERLYDLVAAALGV